MPSQVLRANRFNQNIGGAMHLTKYRMRNSRGDYQSIDVGSVNMNNFGNESSRMPSLGVSNRGSMTAGGSTRRQTI